MTIMKAIAMAALAGTLLAGPSAAIAQSTEHGNSATAHQNNSDRKSGSDTTKGGAGGTVNQGGQGTVGGQDDQDTAEDQDTNDDQNTTDDQDTNDDQDTDGGQASAGNNGKKMGQPNFGTIISSLHRNGTSTDLSTLQDGYTVSVLDASSLKGNKQAALNNALKGVDSTAVQTSLSGNTTVEAALTAQGLTLSDVAYAYVDAQGNLVVIAK